VNGNFTLKSGATYEVEANAQGQSDKVIVNGTVNLTGATLRVLAVNGNYKARTDYTIIENDGSDKVVGTFSQVTSNLAFLRPFVFYNGGDGNDVVLTLLTNSFNFRSVADTRNQRAVAGALDQFPTDNPLFLAVLAQTAEGARQAFDALSGEVHATVAGTLSDDSRYVREAVLGRLMQASHTNGALSAGGPQVASYDSQAMMLGGAMYDGKSLVAEPERAPLAFWTRAFGAWGNFDSDGNAASADRDLGGFISGMDADIGSGWRAGLATGASFSNVDVDDRYSSADVETYHLGGYIGGMAGSFALRGGGMWAWNDIDTSRAVVFPGFFERQSASYDADTGQLFGEVAYPIQMGGIALEPFGGLAFVSVDTDSFRENGGPQASLRGRNLDQDVGYTSLGLRAATTMMLGATQVVPHISAAWLHAFDDVTPGASLAFATTGIGFAINGVPLAEDSALLDAGLDFALGDRMSAGVSYTGQYSDSVTDNGVKGRFTWLF
jgi:outer membrane autotransporter protein